MEMSVHAFVVPEVLPVQRLNVRINGRSIGFAAIVSYTTVAFYVPPDIKGSKLHIILEHPDANRPSSLNGSHDERNISIAVHQINMYDVTDFNLAEFLSKRATFQIKDRKDIKNALEEVASYIPDGYEHFLNDFESVGENCEFGLFQRAVGLEPLGLLRFSTVFLPQLISGVETQFSNLGGAGALNAHIEDDGREWMIREQRYQLRYHSGVREDEATRQEVLARELKKLNFLKRKFLEDVASGHKIFVYKRVKVLEFEEILPLYIALRRYASNSLLWVVQAEPPYQHGTVEEIWPGLYRGHIDKLANIHRAVECRVA